MSASQSTTPFSTASFSVNGRSYRLPRRPVAAVCVDGSSDEYFNAALARNRMPNVARWIVEGHRGIVRGALPSFTNVNNTCLATGVPPAVHGISGNFFFDPERGEEVMMNSADYIRCPTILEAAARAGRRVAMITAKEKLRDLLARDLDGIAFSSEKAAEARRETHGIDNVCALAGDTPPIYSGDASLYVLRAGAVLIERGLADFCYLSLTDYMQHRYRPEDPESIEFYHAIDQLLGRIHAAGAVVGLTADHGMNAKQNADGSPNIVYLQTMLEEQISPGCRVILPITDPYVVHHGALGSFAFVHLPDASLTAKVSRWLLEHDAITEVHDRITAARKLELPADRIGDLAVLSRRDVVLGRTPEHHDLSALQGPLRSHGGRYEEMVPMILSAPLTGEYRRRAAGDPRNFDLFDFLLNGINP